MIRLSNIEEERMRIIASLEWWNRYKEKFRGNWQKLISLIGVAGLSALIASGCSVEEISEVTGQDPEQIQQYAEETVQIEEKEEENLAIQLNINLLARILMSEASVGTSTERLWVGWSVMNRMFEKGYNLVSYVSEFYATDQTPDVGTFYYTLAEQFLNSDPSEDPTGGVTHFFSPRGMDPIGSIPNWVEDDKRVGEDNPNIRDDYFRFYVDIPWEISW